MSFEDKELLEEFKKETTESLEVCESALLKTEHSETFAEGYAEVFRAFHSIKGLSSMFGLDQIQAHFHFLESLLVKYKSQASFPSALVDYFLAATDAALKMIDGKEVVFDLYDPCSGDIQADVEKAHVPPAEPPTLEIVQQDHESLDSDVAQIEQKLERRPVIYIVDNEVDVLEVNCEMLSEFNCDIVPFHSAKEALACLDSSTALDLPTVIVSDISMPEMGGIEFQKKVEKVYPDIQFIFLSAFTEDNVFAESSQSVYGVLNKPVGMVEFQFMVNSALRFYRSQQLVKKSLKFLFYLFSQEGQSNESNRSILRSEIKKMMEELAMSHAS